MLHPTEPESAGLARLLDPISLNIAVRRAFAGLDAGASLFVFGLALLFSVATGAIWWRYDLMSTYAFMQGAQADTAAELSAITGAAADVGLGVFIGAVIVVAFTCLPSIVELIAPRVLHPGVQLALNIAVLFDFVTDWPTAADIVARWGQAPLGIVGAVGCTFLLTLALSLFVQILFILGITALLVAAGNILGGGRRQATPVQILDGGRQ